METVLPSLLWNGEWWCVKMVVFLPQGQELLPETPSQGLLLHLRWSQLTVLPMKGCQSLLKPDGWTL